MQSPMKGGSTFGENPEYGNASPFTAGKSMNFNQTGVTGGRDASSPLRKSTVQ